METFPKIISVDDHTVEPPHVWRDRLPSKYADTGPRVVRAPLKDMTFLGGKFAPVMGAKGDDGPIGDWWVYEDLHRPLTRLDTAVGYDRDEIKLEVITYEQMRPGSFSVPDRLADMDVNHVQSALCFPHLPAVLRTDVHRSEGPRAGTPRRARVQRLDGGGVVRP